MKNFEKYKTAEERVKEFDRFCNQHNGCSACPVGADWCSRCECAMVWLDREANEEEKLLPCPFCGDECACGDGYVECLNDNCCYSSGNRKRSDAVAIAAHNRVARAAMKEKEEHDDQ